jgi:hypothetical protein
MKSTLRALAAILAAGGALLPASGALAWGDAGHRMVAVLGVQALGPEVPAFLKSRKSVFQLGEMAREPDRSRLAGEPHDRDLDPGHFLDLDDDGRALGGPLLTEMPKDKETYETALQKVGTTTYKAGFLYYNLIDGWQQLVKDFAYWRVLNAAEKTAKTSADRKWLKADKELREAIIVRDLGYWAHFVGDGSQPLHLTFHYDGWGPGPNPKGYTLEKLHVPFEGAFVNKNVPPEMARARMYAPETCAPPIATCITRHLAHTATKMEAVYQLWGQDAFKDGDARGEAFAAEALGEGASRLRDYVTAAWAASADADVTFSHIKVREVEAGLPVPAESLAGDK